MRSARVVLATVVAVAAAMLSIGLPAAPAGATACQGRVVVTDAGDDGQPAQLRQAVAQACDGGTVLLRVAEPIVMAEGPVHVDKAVRISGDGATIDARAGAFTVAATGALRLVQLTLTNTTDSPAIGIQIQGGSATLEDVTVTGFNRHGIRMRGGSLMVGGSSAITDNVFPAGVPAPPSGFILPHGAGIFSEGGGSITLRDTATISGNTVVANSPGNIPGTDIPIQPLAYGGGIYLAGGQLTLEGDASVTGNTTAPRPGHPGDATNGGGIVMSNDRVDGVTQRATVLLRDRASITGNTAKRGAGIMNYDSDVILRDAATVTANIAGDGGGGIWTQSTSSHAPTTVTLHDSATITGNTAPLGTGGGIRNIGSGLVTVRDDAAVSGNTLPDILGGTVLP